MAKDFTPDPIPRNSDGRIMLNQYREQMWFNQQAMLDKIETQNGRLGEVEDKTDEMEIDVKVAKKTGQVAVKLLVFLTLIIGIIEVVTNFIL